MYLVGRRFRKTISRYTPISQLYKIPSAGRPIYGHPVAVCHRAAFLPSCQETLTCVSSQSHKPVMPREPFRGKPRSHHSMSDTPPFLLHGGCKNASYQRGAAESRRYNPLIGEGDCHHARASVRTCCRRSFGARWVGDFGLSQMLLDR